MKFEIEAVCPYCGQILFVETNRSDLTDEELRELAIEKCKCEEAARERGIRGTVAAVDDVLGEGAIEKNFGYALTEETRVAIIEICRGIIGRKFDHVQMTEPGGDKISLSLFGNMVRVKRSGKRTSER